METQEIARWDGETPAYQMPEKDSKTLEDGVW